MKNSFKNTFPLDKKYLSLGSSNLKKWENEKWKKFSSTSQKISFYKQNKVSLKKLATSKFENLQQSSE